MSRIDRIYAPKGMISYAFGYTFDPCSCSDHDYVSVKFKCKQMLSRGPGLWKFIFSLTQDDVLDYTRLLRWFLQTSKGKMSRLENLVGRR